MRNLVLLCTLIIVACGNHKSESNGFTATGNVNNGLQDGTVIGQLKTSMDSGNITAFLALLANGAPVDTRLPEAKNATLLIYSASQNLPLFAHYLIQNGADITMVNDDGKTAVQVAENVGGRDRILMLIDPTRQAQAQKELWDAVKKKKIETIRAKLAAGANPNFVDEETGETPLTQTVLLKKAANATTVLSGWTDPGFGITATDINFPNRAGVTPLGFAVQNNNAEVIQVLKNLNAKETL